mmetsp:Transcript_3600/g.8303  ORF Transcript_3600/g.8303 Transcript_3600/m.8303 type:complete len:89 (+) Transcript_3600:2953-3219(+)
MINQLTAIVACTLGLFHCNELQPFIKKQHQEARKDNKSNSMHRYFLFTTFHFFFSKELSLGGHTCIYRGPDKNNLSLTFRGPSRDVMI